jgi:addiction module HigA family antidote
MHAHRATAGSSGETRGYECFGISLSFIARQTAALVGARDRKLPGYVPSRLILKTTTKQNGLPAIHPGEFLREDILPETGLSITAAAKALGVSRQMLHDILAERRPLSAVMCLKVSRLFGSSPEMWMRLQAAYDLKKASQDKKVMDRVARIVPIQTNV